MGFGRIGAYGAFILLFMACDTQGQPTCDIFFKDGLSVERALRDAFMHRSDLHARKHTIKQRRLEQRVELSPLLPQITLQNLFITGTPRTFAQNEIDIEVTQRLIDLGTVLHSYSAARELTHVAEHARELTRDLVKRGVEKSLLDLWEAQREQLFVATRWRASQTQFSRARSRCEAGTIDGVELAQERSQDASVLAETKKYPEALFIGGRRVSRSIEGKFDGKLDDASMCAFVDHAVTSSYKRPLDFYLDQSCMHRQEILIKDAEICSEEHRATREARGYLPTISFVARYNKSGISGLFGPQDQDPLLISCGDCGRKRAGFQGKAIWRAGIQLDWNFDGLASVHRASAAEESVSRLFAERRNTIEQVRLEVKEQYALMQRSQHDICAAEELFLAEKKTYIQKESEFDVGMITKVDVAAARRDFAEAKFKFEQAQIRVSDQYSELLFRSGYPETCVKEELA